MAQKISGIYSITNLVNNKIYIGQSINIRKRWNQHKRDLKNGNHHNPFLQSAWNKYGKDNFKFEIIEKCPEEKLDEREEYYIKCYDSMNHDKGYNLTSGGDAPHDFSPSTIEKLRSHGGKKIICLNTGKIYNKIKDAVKETGVHPRSLRRCLTGYNHYAERSESGELLQWSYYEEGKEYKLNECLKRRSVICINTQKIYHTINEASRDTGVKNSTIADNCKGRRKFAGIGKDGRPLEWAYYKIGETYEYDDSVSGKYKNTTTIHLLQFDAGHNVIGKFYSREDAAEKLGLTITKINYYLYHNPQSCLKLHGYLLESAQKGCI